VQEAVTRHQLAGVPAMALARGMTSAVLAAATSSDWHRVSFQWAARSALGTLHVDIRHPGDLRGYVHLAEGAESFVGRSIEEWVRPGLLVGLRQEASGRFAQGRVAIEAGSVDEDVEAYLRTSEQVASGLRVLATQDSAGGPLDVVGVLVQTLPGGDPASTVMPADYSDRTRSPVGPLEGILEAALPDMSVEVLEELPLRFHCLCTRERVETSIRLLGESEIAGMIAAREETSVRCEFCATAYEVGLRDLQKILKGLRAHPIGEA
jgi:molecular chaperone Hsp33